MIDSYIFWIGVIEVFCLLLVGLVTLICCGVFDDNKINLHDEFIFYTQTPSDLVGTVRDGKMITRVVPTVPTALTYGVSAPCWSVYAVKLDEIKL